LQQKCDTIFSSIDSFIFLDGEVFMPPSGKLPKVSTYNGPYPRRKDSIWYILRTVLLFSWAILVFYGGNALWNFYYTDYSKPESLASLKDVINALVVPAFMRDPNAPFGVSIPFALLFLVVLGGYIWATLDLKHEQKVVQTHEIAEEVDISLQTRGPNTQLPKPQGPPFDIESPSHPDKFIGRAEEKEWLLGRLRTRKRNRVTALWGPVGIGKTVLAIEALRTLRTEKRFKDGIVVIPCQGISSVEEGIQNILMRFDPYGRPPDANTLQGLRNDMYRLLNGKSALIVLDTIKHDLAIEKVIEYLLSPQGISILLIAQHDLSQVVSSAKVIKKLKLFSPQESLDLFAHFFDVAVNDSGHAEYSRAKRVVKQLGYDPYAIRIVGVYANSCKRDLGKLEQELSDNLRRAINMADNYGKPGAVQIAFETSTKEDAALQPEARKLFLH